MAAVKRTRKETASKIKVFSRKWLDLDIMKDWLVPHSDPVKAMCRVCNKVINAGKSELVKHASGLKHSQKLMELKAGKSRTQEALDFITNSLTIETEPCIETAEEKQSTETNKTAEIRASTSSTKFENNHECEETYQKKHIELLSRIASALDRIASSQETLVKIKLTEEQRDKTSDNCLRSTQFIKTP